MQKPVLALLLLSYAYQYAIAIFQDRIANDQSTYMGSEASEL
jgi:hypothetical protein